MIKFTKTKRWLDKKTATTSPVSCPSSDTIRTEVRWGNAGATFWNWATSPAFSCSESFADDASVRLDRPKGIIRDGLCVVRVDRAHSGPPVLDRISWVPAPVNE